MTDVLDNVERTPVSPGRASRLKALALIFPCQGVAQFAISRHGRILAWALLLGGVIGTLWVDIAVLWFLPGLTAAMKAVILVFVNLGDLIPVVLGYLMLRGRFLIKPVTFDRNQGLFWRGPVPPDPFDPERSLGNIAAIQLCRGGLGGSPYRAIELNLVLKDPPGKRLTVLSHSHAEEMIVEATALSEFLSVPVLDHRRDE